jgi:hypothetical protein
MTVIDKRPRRRAAEPIRAPCNEDPRHNLSPLDAWSPRPTVWRPSTNMALSVVVVNTPSVKQSRRTVKAIASALPDSTWASSITAALGGLGDALDPRNFDRADADRLHADARPDIVARRTRALAYHPCAGHCPPFRPLHARWSNTASVTFHAAGSILRCSAHRGRHPWRE